MSDDEFDDDQSLDDEFENSLKSPANEALQRVEARKPPTDEDADLTGPILRELAN